ncbi:hypothetical protein BH20CHL6_BH20CHL6_13450 [soil metagenome]
MGIEGASDGSTGIAPEGRPDVPIDSGGFGPGGSDERPERASSTSPSAAPAVGDPPAGPSSYGGRMTPAVRRVAREHGVDLAAIRGSGHAGRVSRDDVMHSHSN